jgi:hypothetical protein
MVCVVALVCLVYVGAAGASSVIFTSSNDDGSFYPGDPMIGLAQLSLVPISHCPSGGTGDSTFNIGADFFYAPVGTTGFMSSKFTAHAAFGTNVEEGFDLGGAPGPGDWNLLVDECQDGQFDPGIDGIAAQFSVKTPLIDKVPSILRPPLAAAKESVRISAASLRVEASTLEKLKFLLDLKDQFYDTPKEAFGTAGKLLDARTLCTVEVIVVLPGAIVLPDEVCEIAWEKAQFGLIDYFVLTPMKNFLQD